MEDSKEKTRDHLLDTAFDLFAENGYRSTTVAKICEEAEVNIASVNYHFGSKEDLYKEVWRVGLDDVISDRVEEQNDFQTRDPEDRLRERIHLTVKRHLSLGEPGKFTSMIMHEMNNPTGLIDTVLEGFVSPIRTGFLADIAELLDADPDEQVVRFTLLSIFNQCFGLRFRNLSEEGIVDFESFEDDDVEDLADHIADFSLNGIRLMKKQTINEGSEE